MIAMSLVGQHKRSHPTVYVITCALKMDRDVMPALGRTPDAQIP